MNVVQETRPRIAQRAHFMISLLVLAAFSSAATYAQETPTKQATSSTSEPQTGQKPTERTTFTLKLISDGILCPMNNLSCEEKDIRWKNFTLLASDGHTLHLTSIPFPSVERSKKRFDRSIKEADQILRRSLESNGKGDQIGERALGLFTEVKDSKPPTDARHYMLFWMWGANFWEINGEHLEDVLALEERLKEEGVGAVWRWHPKISLGPD